MTPLPTVHHPDPFRAAWAAARAEELERLAERVEARSRSLARPLWEHAACLDPRRPHLSERAAAARPVRVHRPPVVEVEHGGISPPTSELEAPILLPRAASPPRAAPAPDAAAAVLADVEAAVAEARFEAALEAAARGRDVLQGMAPGAARVRARVRLELAAATAAVALGEEAQARRSLRAALQADPLLRPDPQRLSPKVRRLLDEARVAERLADVAP